MLKNHFDRIVLLTLKGAEKRASSAIENMIELGLIKDQSEIEILYGVRGDDLFPPAYWQSGNAAWGCLCSHVRALQSAWIDGVEKLLVLEDDCGWTDWACEAIPELMNSAPYGWGQLYLGGQHRAEPEIMERSPWMAARSVNRTHAYAVSRATIPRLISHVMHAPDYMGNFKHIDHQLEVAHQRGDWTVYAPLVWPAGQRENNSQITGKWESPKWWDWDFGNGAKALPLIIVKDQKDLKGKPLHTGWKKSTAEYLSHGKHGQVMAGALEEISKEAWDQRRLPAVISTDVHQISLLKTRWQGGVIDLCDLSEIDLKKLTDFRDRVKPPLIDINSKVD